MSSKMAKPQFRQWHYTYSILFDPEQPKYSPQLDLGISLVQMMYPEKQARFFTELLYLGDEPDAYKDRIIREQREKYRIMLIAPADHNPDGYIRENIAPEDPAPPALVVEDINPDDPVQENLGVDEEYPQENLYEPEYPQWWSSNSSNWRYRENITVMNTEYQGIMVKREIETYTGGAHGFLATRYYVIDLDSLRLVKIDDVFQDYQGDATRAVVYEELRNYCGLSEDQPLSEGIFFSDEPELCFNFYFTEEGIGLHWDPAQIASYSRGSINIIVPWRKIRPFLLNSGMELLTKFNIFLFVG